MKAADIFAVLKMKSVAIAVSVNFSVHIFGSILRCTKTETVKTERKFIVICTVSVFTAGIHFAENKLPVFLFFNTVIINGYACTEILHLNGAVFKASYDNLITSALSGFIN